MADLTPNNREEYWLKGMVDGQTTLEPNKRREYWYKEIVDAIGSGGGGGTGGGALIVHENDGTLDKTWNEINNANLTVIIESNPFGKAYIFVTVAMDMGGIYKIQGISSMQGEPIYPSYSASTADDYPVLD